MTVTDIKRAFGRLDANDQARLLKDLAATLADSLASTDVQDGLVFTKRRTEELRARPWPEVRTRLLKSQRRTRKRAR